MDAEDKPAEPDNMKDQPVPAKNATPISSNSSQDAAIIGYQRDNTGQLAPFGSSGDRIVYPQNVFAPQAQPFYYRGFKNAIVEWDEYPPYVNAEGLEISSSGVYNDDGSIVFHTGYGYAPQMPYGPFSPATTPLPSIGGDAHLYNPQQFPFPGPPYYQPFGPATTPYFTSPTSVSQQEFNTLASIDQQGDDMVLGPRPGYAPLGSIGRGSFPRNLGTLGFHDSQQGFDGLRSGGIWSDWSKLSDRNRPLTPLLPAVSPQLLGTLGSYGQSVGMTSQLQRSFYDVGSGSNSYTRGYIHSSFDQGSGFGSASISSLGANNRGFLSFENNIRHGGASISLCGCNGNFDIHSEQNRGPRASKPKCQNTADHTCPVDNNRYIKSIPNIHSELYNQLDFVTEYKDAKFFVIKSYSEDNVHKSIKYGVWASTPNGNRKLDAAYREAKKKQDPCPVFLFFSVNASAQFCGVAEMVGAVDFDKSVNYWQQDKWSGQFPVKWHIIKDVPNSQFRHIVLEMNDNKPVTNSRDTQEVKLGQGVEMLNIFKKYETEMSILDDFEFYEERERAMQERKARQQVNVGVGGEDKQRNAVALKGDLVKQVSKSFVQVVRLDEGNKDDGDDKNNINNNNEEGSCVSAPVSDSSASAGVNVEDGATTVISSN